MRKLRTEELNRLSIDQFKTAKKNPIILILDNVRSLHNIGAIFRTADAFLVEKIYLCGISATPPNREIHKTALGATESVDWEYVADALLLVHRLQDEGYWVGAVEQVKDSTYINDFQTQADIPYALIFGNEVKGVQQHLVSAADGCIEIPQQGTKHSLNISVSVGIALWEFVRQLSL